MSSLRRKTYKSFITGAPVSKTTKRRHKIMNVNSENRLDISSEFPMPSTSKETDFAEFSAVEESTSDSLMNNGEVPVQIQQMDVEVNRTEPYDKDYLSQPVRSFLKVTKFEALLGILHFSVSNNLTGNAIVQLIELINTILDVKDAIPASKYKFDKIFSNNLLYNVHYYCSKCYIYFGEKETCKSLSQCQHCTEPVNINNMNDKNYFVSIPLRNQLQQILEEEGVAELLSYPFERTVPENCVSDLFDGQTYKKLANDGLLGPNIDSISLTFSCDGAGIFKSSKGSLWPIQCRINELPPKERFLPHRLLVAGLWFGKQEPVPATFLKPFLEELNSFSVEPVQWTDSQTGKVHFTKVYVRFGIFDAPAKCIFQCMTQFNGYNGCPYCCHPGTLDKKQIRYDNVPYPSRTHEKVRLDMIAANRKGCKVNGIKGLSPMLLHKEFDLVNSYPIDYMHQTLLGVTKYICSAWIDTTCHDEPFYLSKNLINCVDERLVNIQPPSNISRAPRRFSDCNLYKANEWRAWLLFYSIPCLQSILHEKYLKHFSLLASSIYTLLQESISAEELDIVEENLTEFVDQFNTLYSLSRMTFNVHLLTHLVNCVRQTGPLWANSMFPFESGLGFLLKFIKGKTAVLSQVSTKYCNIFQIPKTVAVYGGQNSSILEYCDKVFTYPRLQKVKVFGQARLLGSQKPFKASIEHLKAFQEAGLPSPDNCYCGQKIIMNGIVFAVEKEGALRNDSVVNILDKYYRILNFIFYSNDDSKLYFICKEIVLTKRLCLSPHIKICKPYYGKMFVFQVEDIKRKSIMLKVKKIDVATKILQTESDLFITDFPNFFERD